MWQTFEVVLRVVIFGGIALYMWSVSSALERMAQDISLLAGRPGAKPAADDAERAVDA